MVAVVGHFGFDLLDDIDITADLESALRKVDQVLPGLEAAFDSAARFAFSALAAAPPGYDDDVDDDVAFRRLGGSVGLDSKHRALAEARQELLNLKEAVDPRRFVAKAVLSEAHESIKAEFHETSKRLNARPTTRCGLSLADVVWEARNQAEHHSELKPHKSVKRVFAALSTCSPGTFGLASPPADDAAVVALVTQQSWAIEVLLWLGWTSSSAVKVALSQIST